MDKRTRAMLFGLIALLVQGPSAVRAQNPPSQELPAPSGSLEDALFSGGIYADLRAEADTLRGRFRRPPNLDIILEQPRFSPVFSNVDRRQITVKFREGSGIRLRDGGLRIDASGAALATLPRLLRAGIDAAVVERDLTELSQLVQLNSAAFERLAPRVAEADLDRLRLAAERNTGAEHPDLNLWYAMFIPERANADALLAQLRALPSVQYAYFEPIPEDAGDIPPTTTICMHPDCPQPRQGYLGPAPDGIDLTFARQFRGGRGEGVRIIDIERRWLPAHEDFPESAQILVDHALPTQPSDDTSHGTGVLGILWAVENGFGVTGIAPRARVGFIAPVYTSNTIDGRQHNVAAALAEAGKFLHHGDVILIEQQFPADPLVPCVPVRKDCGVVPTEVAPAVHETIVNLINGGRLVVVEAAGNGSQRIELPTAAEPAGASPSDHYVVAHSGAILVGAVRSAAPHAVSGFSNRGSRIDVHAWGDGIATLGPGFGESTTFRGAGADARQVYRTDFNGTSGASPIVTGAVVLIQSTRDAAGLPRLNAREMRNLLRDTGSGSTAGVGSMPNLRAAIATYRARRLRSN